MCFNELPRFARPKSDAADLNHIWSIMETQTQTAMEIREALNHAATADVRTWAYIDQLLDQLIALGE